MGGNWHCLWKCVPFCHERRNAVVGGYAGYIHRRSSNSGWCCCDGATVSSIRGVLSITVNLTGGWICWIYIMIAVAFPLDLW